MARIKDTCVAEVKAAADIVEVVVGAHAAAQSVGARYTGRCPFHEERTPSFSVDPVDKLYYCFGCGKGGDVVRFVRETENLDFAGAIEWLADRFRVPARVRGDLAAGRTRRAGAASGSPRCSSRRRRSSSAYLWETRGRRAGARLPRGARARRGDLRRSSGSGSRRGSGLVAKARESGFHADEIRAAGLANQRGNDYFPCRLMFPLADARGRIIGFQARELRDDDPLKGKYVNSPESELFKKGNVLYGLHLARPAIAKQDRAIVVEGNTDVIALRQAGVEPVVASMGTALTERQLPELGAADEAALPLLRRRRGRAGGDAARDGAGACGRASTCASSRCRRARIRPTRPTSFEERLGSAESYLHYRVRHRARARRPTGRRRSCGPARSSRPSRTRPSARRRCGSLADRLDLPRETLAGLAPARSARAPSVAPTATPRLLEAGLQRERDLLAAVVRNPSLVAELAALTPEHFDEPLHRRFREVLLGQARRGRGACRVARGARRARRPGRDRRADREGAAPPAARAPAAARAPGRRPRSRDGAAGPPREGAPRPRRARCEPLRRRRSRARASPRRRVGALARPASDRFALRPVAGGRSRASVPAFRSAI